MQKRTPPAHVVIVTGLSGAGRSNAANVLEDIGYFVVDNLPISMISDLVDSIEVVDGERSRIAVVADTRAGMDGESLDLALIDLHHLLRRNRPFKTVKYRVEVQRANTRFAPTADFGPSTVVKRETGND